MSENSKLQGKNWCFTDFDVSMLNYMEYVSWHEDGLVSYLIIGKETCPTSGRKHLQGFCVFKTNKRFAAVKKLHPTTSWRLCKGTAQQNIVYCSKAGDFDTFGNPPMSKKEQGLRDKERWTDVIRSAREGTAAEEYPGEYIRYNSTIKKLARHEYPLWTEVENVWIWGPTGTGKSRYVVDNFPGLYKKLHNKWWDDYEEQEVVLIDDLMPNTKGNMGGHLLNWCYGHACRVEYKGGSRMIRPKKIFVTSNYSIAQCFPDLAPVSIQALERRFESKFMGPEPEVIDLTSPNIEELITLDDQLLEGQVEYERFMQIFK